jgi:hypothetical protein
MMTIEYLRALAQLNLCENCFQKYKMLIEPSIRGYLSKPLNDWREAETEITQLVMKTKGIFKGDMWVLSFDDSEEEKVAQYLDVKAFRKIERWRVKERIDYLYENGIIQDYSYKVLDKARKARNKIHEEPSFVQISDEDYALFSVANWIASQILSTYRVVWGEGISAKIRSNAEKVAEQWLSQIERQKTNLLSKA